jgi:N-acetylmuramoyl-L-alanine amidase
LSVDLRRPVLHRAYTSPAGKGVRLIVELVDSGSAKTGTRPKTGKAAHALVRRNSGKHKIRVVAIDAGHGGKDTGAIGPGSPTSPAS